VLGDRALRLCHYHRMASVILNKKVFKIMVKLDFLLKYRFFHVLLFARTVLLTKLQSCSHHFKWLKTKFASHSSRAASAAICPASEVTNVLRPAISDNDLKSPVFDAS